MTSTNNLVKTTKSIDTLHKIYYNFINKYQNRIKITLYYKESCR